MKNFFKVKSLEDVGAYVSIFPPVEKEDIALDEARGRILGNDFIADADLPDFKRSAMDGYAVCASSVYGASESNPAYLVLKGNIEMGKASGFSIKVGEAARIATGGMIPEGGDSVVMIEHTEVLDENSVEAYKSVAYGQHAIEIGEDYKAGDIVIRGGSEIRAQEIGIFAAFGKKRVSVFKKPKVGIISTGDEISAIEDTPKYGKIRDVNTYTISALVEKAGGIPFSYGIVKDDYDSLFNLCSKVSAETDMLILSGGSSIGTRDYTVKVFSDLENSEIIAHGISISPGKPTILANARGKALWGLPGHVVSAMIVFEVLVKKFVEKIGGLEERKKVYYPVVRLLRNISSAQGRVDFVRVKLIKKDGVLGAEPILGKSGLINTMVKADGLIRIERDTEGLDKGSEISVIPI